MVEIEVKREKLTTIDFSKLNKNFWMKVGNRMVSSTQNKINKGITPVNAPLTMAVKSGNRTLRDRGQLMSSLTRNAEDSSVRVGTNRAGSKINHFGGTVSARRTWLFIPASSWTRDQQKKFGYSATAVIKGLRGMGLDVFFRINRNKQQGVVVSRPKGLNGKKEKKANTTVVFILKKKVEIPARPFLFVNKEDMKEIENLATREIKVQK